MTVELEPVAYTHKPVLRRLLELYLYDFTEFTGDDLNEHGEFGYRYLDHYWVPNPDDQRFPFLIRVDGKLAGCALVRLRRGRYSMAEFFVMRRYRRGGVGAQAAKAVFARFPGDWEVWQLPSNLPAQAFWRKVINEVTGGVYTERAEPDGVGQLFTVR
ncbi:MAG: GNAT family N-acetyltransferase [Anaerolinea sp.]|nr:GNAT family N-acetyltransferase [Anaerolinea sp.]